MRLSCCIECGSLLAATFLRIMAAGLAGATASAQEEILFVEVTDAVGLGFLHEAGEDGNYPMPASLGSGAALLDYDGDGDLDIYLLQGGSIGSTGAGPSPPNRLYRQEANGRFVDVTVASGLGDRGYGMGVAVGDVDDDGDLDVYVSNYGPDALYINRGDGTFRRMVDGPGGGDDRWSASALFCDVDRDGDLDLFVTRYVEWGLDRLCFGSSGEREYCGPNNLPGVPDTLYRNTGAGALEEVRGFGAEPAPSLGAVCLDFSGDTRPELFVAVDGKANHLWTLRDDGSLTDGALLSGVAFNAFGQPEAGMGVAAADFDGDGAPDLMLSHFTGETNTLYGNRGRVGFQDISVAAGMGKLTLTMTGFGIAPLDYDHDGDLDVAVVNGRIAAYRAAVGDTLEDHWNRYAERNLLLANDGHAHFRDVSAGTGRFGSLVEMSRSLAVGDVDADGDIDLLVTNTGSPARLFHNEAPKRGSWLMMRVLTSKGRDAYGSRLRVDAGGTVLMRELGPGYGYLASHDPRAHCGLPGSPRTVEVTITWPGGRRRLLRGVPVGRVLTVAEE